jgi:hypothetical protein
MQVAISVTRAEEETDVAAAAARAQRVKAFIKEAYGFEPLSESSAYITYLIARSNEPQLPGMLKALESRTNELQISDLQVWYPR